MIRRKFLTPIFSLLLLGSTSSNAQTLLSQYEFNGNLTNASTFMDTNGVEAPDGTFREGTDLATAPVGSPTFVLGVDGTPSGALFLDGLNDWIDVTTAGHPGQPVPPDFTFGPGFVSGTVMAWVKTSATASGQSRWLMGSANANDFQSYRFGWNGSQLESVAQASDSPVNQFRVADPTHNLSWADGQWHHVAVQWDGFEEQGDPGPPTNAKLYLDGVPLGADEATFMLDSSDVQTPWEFPMAIGARNNGGTLGGFWEGAIDDLRVYANDLSDIAIQDIFNAVNVAVEPDFDSDGDVDGADFLAWQRGVAAGTTFPDGDANNSGTVDATDLAIWQAAYGSSNPIVASLQSVPEPNALGLLLVAAMARFCCRSRPN